MLDWTRGQGRYLYCSYSLPSFYIFQCEKVGHLKHGKWLISLFVLLSRCGLFVYPQFQPPWDNGKGLTVFQNFTVWGSAGGAQVSCVSFLLNCHLFSHGDLLCISI